MQPSSRGHAIGGSGNECELTLCSGSGARGGVFYALKVNISLPLRTLDSYPHALTGFPLELPGFLLRNIFNSTASSRGVVLVPTETHQFLTHLLSTHRVPRILAMAENGTGTVPAIVQLHSLARKTDNKASQEEKK